MKKYSAIEILWIISVMVISVVTLTLSIVSIVGYNLPDAARIILGVADMIALFVLAFTTARKFIDNKKTKS